MGLIRGVENLKPQGTEAGWLIRLRLVRRGWAGSRKHLEELAFPMRKETLSLVTGGAGPDKDGLVHLGVGS